MSGSRWLLLGGGISGLAAARLLEENGENWILVEREEAPGGLTRSICHRGFFFDYTGHLLHLRRYETPAEIPFADLENEEWQSIPRSSKCLVEDTLVTAPIQYNLNELPRSLASECLSSYRRASARKGGVDSFQDYLVSGFGERLANLFLIPQNEKTFAVDLNKLEKDTAKRFFPPPDREKIEAGATGRPRPTSGYNARYWYPNKGGIERLVRGLATGLNRARMSMNTRVAALNLPHREAITADGRRLKWDIAISSIPLKDFCLISGDPDLERAGKKLSHSTTVAFNLALRKVIPDEYKGVHWVYTPDRDLPFYRVGFYSNISSGTCPEGCGSLYAECGLPGGGQPDSSLVQMLQVAVLEGLEKMGICCREEIQFVVPIVIPCAYVHFTPARQKVLPQIVSHLRDFSVLPVGRYGLWDYLSMEDSMESGFGTVRELLDANQRHRPSS